MEKNENGADLKSAAENVEKDFYRNVWLPNECGRQ